MAVHTEHFLKNYLKFSVDGLDRSYMVPLPPIEGLEPKGEFIVQGKLDQTYSTNIIFKYESERARIRLVEVYKNSEDQVQGVFVRLVGTMALVRKGYPFLFLDAAVTNVSVFTGEREDLSTRVVIHFPQADRERRKALFEKLTSQAQRINVESSLRETDRLPDFWGGIWGVQAKGLNLGLIRQVRDFAWTCYEEYCRETPEQPDFDYKPMQYQMSVKNAALEHGTFKKMGLSVAPEAQSAFFSIQCFIY